MLAYQVNNNDGWFFDGLIGFEPDYGTLTIPYMTEQLGFVDPSTPSTSTPSVGGVSTVKKLNHNASERDRRKKMNCFYSSLRSLLPPADQKKKISIPATVSWVLKYIPELQQQVHCLNRQKDDLLATVSKAAGADSRRGKRQRSSGLEATAAAVSVSRLTQEEVVFQISREKVGGGNTPPFSEILGNLEKDGFFPVNASTFESFGGRVFYSIHVQMGRSMSMETEALREKILSYCRSIVLV